MRSAKSGRSSMPSPARLSPRASTRSRRAPSSAAPPVTTGAPRCSARRLARGAHAGSMRSMASIGMPMGPLSGSGGRTPAAHAGRRGLCGTGALYPRPGGAGFRGARPRRMKKAGPSPRPQSIRVDSPHISSRTDKTCSCKPSGPPAPLIGSHRVRPVPRWASPLAPDAKGPRWRRGRARRLPSLHCPWDPPPSSVASSSMRP